MNLRKAGIAVTTALKLDATHQPALLLHGTITEAYHDKGEIYLGNGQYTEAVAAFQKAIILDADLGDSLQISHTENTHIHVSSRCCLHRHEGISERNRCIAKSDSP